MSGSLVDMTYLKNISMGNKIFELKMLRTFVEQTVLEMEKIGEFIQQKNWDSLSASAHKIKPSFHFIGALKTEALLNTIEIFAKQKNNLEKLNRLVSVFLRSCPKVIENVRLEITKYPG